MRSTGSITDDEYEEDEEDGDKGIQDGAVNLQIERAVTRGDVCLVSRPASFHRAISARDDDAAPSSAEGGAGGARQQATAWSWARRNLMKAQSSDSHLARVYFAVKIALF